MPLHFAVLGGRSTNFENEYEIEILAQWDTAPQRNSLFYFHIFKENDKVLI